MGFRGIPESQNENRKKVIEIYKNKQKQTNVQKKGEKKGISKSIDRKDQNQQRKDQNQQRNRKDSLYIR